MKNIISLIEKELQVIVRSLGEQANVPKKTGNLRASIKYERIGPNSFRVYIDETQAPYAAQVEEIKPYWNRVAMQLAYRLNAALGGRGKRDDTPDARK